MRRTKKRLYYTNMPCYEVFFDQDGKLITYVHENDAIFRDEYHSSLFEHYGIEVEGFEIPERLWNEIDEYFRGKRLKYDPEKESLEHALIRMYVRPVLEEKIRDIKQRIDRK